MSTIQAVYENGVFKPKVPVSLPDGCEVTVEVPTPAEESASRGTAGTPASCTR